MATEARSAAHHLGQDWIVLNVPSPREEMRGEEKHLRRKRKGAPSGYSEDTKTFARLPSPYPSARLSSGNLAGPIPVRWCRYMLARLVPTGYFVHAILYVRLPLRVCDRRVRLYKSLEGRDLEIGVPSFKC